MMRASIIALLVAFVGLATADAKSNILFIMDSSNSMWGQVNGVAKIETAKSALARLIGDLPDDTRVGLLAYGHRETGECEDVELLIPIADDAAAAVLSAIDALTPRGKTPIAASLVEGGNAFDGVEGARSVVLISDGVETCGGDPCGAAEALAAASIGTRVHVVGFDLTAEEQAELECIAEKGKGRYFAASSTEDFGAAVAEAVEVARSEPAPEPPIELAQAETGAASRTVAWSVDFDSFDLPEGWTVLNPNPDNYIIDSGELLMLATSPQPFAAADAQNLITVEDGLPGGDWDIDVFYRSELRTGADDFLVGLRKDELNHMVVEIWTDGGYCQTVNLRITKVSNGDSTFFNTQMFNECGNDKVKYNAMIDAIADGGGTLTLSKRGRSYFASSTVAGYQGEDGTPTVWSTDRLTSLRPPGPLTFGVSKYSADQQGETLVFIDKVEAISVEGAE